MPWHLAQAEEERTSGPLGQRWEQGWRKAAPGGGWCRGRARWAQSQGLGVRGPGGCAEGEVDARRSASYGGEERQSDCETLVPGGVGTARGAPRAVGLVGDLCAEAGRCYWRWVGWTWARSAARLCVRGLRRRRRSRVARLWAGEPEACGSLPPRSSAAIFGESIWSFVAVPPWLACREGHGPGQQGGLHGPRSASQYPGAQALDRHDEPLSRRGKGLQEGLRVGLHMARHQNLAALVEEAERHGAGMQVDAAGKWVRSGRKAQ